MTNWIETKDRLPTEADADRDGDILVRDVADDQWMFLVLDDFEADLYPAWIPLAYQPPAPEYRPFTKDEFLPHKDRWLKDQGGSYFHATSIYTGGVAVAGGVETWPTLFCDYLFADDGTPCGVQI